MTAIRMALTRRARRSEIALAPAGRENGSGAAGLERKHESRHSSRADARLVRFPGLRPAGGIVSGVFERGRPASSLALTCFSATQCDQQGDRNANGPALARIG